jgi:hypothetical protein
MRIPVILDDSWASAPPHEWVSVVAESDDTDEVPRVARRRAVARTRVVDGAIAALMTSGIS